jgi:hypothetical protein
MATRKTQKDKQRSTTHAHKTIDRVTRTPGSQMYIIYVSFRLTRRVPLVEHELLTLPEPLSSPPVFSGIRVTRSLV